jgi:hypothetical protein
MLDHITGGRPCLYLDFENGWQIIAERLRDMQAPENVLDERLFYVPFPKGITLDGFYDRLKEVIDQHPDLLIVVDSWRGVGARLGGEIRNFNQNDTVHVERVYAPLMSVKDDGATVLVLDHPNRTTTSASEYLAGHSAAKEQVADAIYWFEKIEPFSVDREGAVMLQTKQDRRGRLDFDKHNYRVGGQGDDGRLELRPVASHEVGAKKQIDNTIQTWLAKTAPNADNAVTQRYVEKAVEGTAKDIRDELQRLAKDPDSPVQATNDGRWPKYWCPPPEPPI